jgi:hypothetical protein
MMTCRRRVSVGGEQRRSRDERDKRDERNERDRSSGSARSAWGGGDMVVVPREDNIIVYCMHLPS